MYAAAIKLADAATVESARYRFYGGSSPLEPIYELKGKSYLREKRYEAAYNAYRQQAAGTRYDSDRKAAEASMRRAAQQGKLYEKWIPEQLKKVTDNPDDLDARFTLAQSYESNDMISEAIAEYQKISELQPDSWQWPKKLGDLYHKQSQQPRETGEVVEGTALSFDGNSNFLAQAEAAYESALQLDPNSYELYRLLAQIYKKGEQPVAAEKVYRRALEASLTQSEYDAAVKAILTLYSDAEEEDKHIVLLEELQPKMENSAVLHELLGDAYKKVGDTEKAKTAYNHWIKRRQREINRAQGYWYYSDFAEKLLDKGFYPETALQFAKRAAQRSTRSSYILTLGHAYLANEQYAEALNAFIRGLNAWTDINPYRDIFSRIAETGKKLKNQERYLEMLNTLIDAMSHNLSMHLHLSLVLAEFYRENNMPEKAKASVQGTGFITTDAWWTLGPFDNTNGIGYDIAYIPENVTQIDTATQYNGIDRQVRWKSKSADKTLDGYIGFDPDVDWGVAYAFTTVISPDERQVQIRFDSDDQGKIWLNGREVHAHTHAHSATLDRYIIPVTLKPGENSILVKVCEEAGGWGFYTRITDPDGKPFDDLKIIDIAK